MTTLTLRRYRPDDETRVWDLHTTALAAIGALAPAGPHDADLHAIEAVYLAPGGEFLIGELNGEPVAMGAVRPLGDGRGELRRMRVHPDHQGRGFGQAMLGALEARAGELGLRALVLDTAVKQTAAIALYRKNGYALVAEREGLGMAALHFEKRLVAVAERTVPPPAAQTACGWGASAAGGSA
jgi:ribosomal protein S18 acetylase RimI-like enzyme